MPAELQKLVVEGAQQSSLAGPSTVRQKYRIPAVSSRAVDATIPCALMSGIEINQNLLLNTY